MTATRPEIRPAPHPVTPEQEAFFRRWLTWLREQPMNPPDNLVATWSQPMPTNLPPQTGHPEFRWTEHPLPKPDPSMTVRLTPLL